MPIKVKGSKVKKVAAGSSVSKSVKRKEIDDLGKAKPKKALVVTMGGGAALAGVAFKLTMSNGDSQKGGVDSSGKINAMMEPDAQAKLELQFALPATGGAAPTNASSPSSAAAAAATSQSPAGEIQPALSWNNTQGGLDLRYTVEKGALQAEMTINVHWASGTAAANQLGAAIFSHTVASGTAAGSYGPIHIGSGSLVDSPAGTTHLIAFADQAKVGSVQDVQVTYGANANAAAVSAAALRIVKNGLRAAGQSTVTITSTARSPADQARAMFNNLVNPANTVAVNVANQLALYAAPGDAVINVFSAQTQGMTLNQINQHQTGIRAAMEQEINNQGPSSVSRHCADPAQLTVIDVGAGAFNATNGPLFVASVTAAASNLIDERATNNCYHIEVVP